MTWLNAIINLIEKVPFLRTLFEKLFEQYMLEKHRINMKDFLEAENKARKTGDVTELQKIIGRKL